MEVIEDAKKVINQALGRENMFHFQTTLANQLYLLFCTFGNAFFTDKLHRKTKYVWFCVMCSMWLMVFISIASYVMYGRDDNDILIPIYNVFLVAITFLETTVKPAVAIFQYRHDIEEVISMADKILLGKSSNLYKCRDKLGSKKSVVHIVVMMWGTISIFSLISILDMVLLYEEEKLKNYLYYLEPLCGLELYGSWKFYVIFNFANICIATTLYTLSISFLIFVLLFAEIFLNEAERIVNQFNSLSFDEDVNVDNYLNMEPKFRDVIRKSVLDINYLTKIITYFRGYLSTIASFTMPVTLYIEIVHAIIFLSPKYQNMVKLKELSAFIATMIPIYTMCWVGATFKDIAEELSLAVYSTPWYWLKSIRKDIYTLLCQTQRPINVLALNVYPLSLATFLRFCNVIHSATNLFRAHFH